MLKKSLICFFALFVSFSAFADGPSDNKIVIQLFLRQVKLLNFLKEDAERIDQARIYVLANSLNAIIDNINSNIASDRPSTNFQTLRLIQNLVIQYRFSQSFFGWSLPIAMTSIYTEANANYISELQTLAKKVEQDFGFDDSPYTRITSNTFKQMQKLLVQVESLAIDQNLKLELRSLWPLIGDVISIADQGDRPKAFEKALPLIEKIRDQYPRFDKISSSIAGFNTILELQGLVEFYAEFAQVD